MIDEMRTTIAIIITAFLSLSIIAQDVVVDKLMQARALASSGKPDLAIAGLSELINSSSDYRLYLERADAYSLTGDYSAAISDYNEANRLSRGSGEYGLARIYAFRGDAQTALYHLELNLESAWKKSEKEIMLDPSFGALGNRPEWRNFWKKERYSGIERNVSEIEYYTSSGMTDDARQLLSEMKVNYPGSGEAAYSEALVSLITGKASDAVRIATRLVEENDKNEKYLRILARAQETSSNAAGASETYSRLLQSGVADARLLLSRAECYRKTGEHDRALADVEKYLSFYPDDKEALRMAGRTQAVTGDNLKALELFSKNLQLHPNDPELYVDRGNSYFAARSWDRAINDYSMSLDLKPGNPDVWLNKGVALLNTGKKQEACHDFRKALSLGSKRASEYITRNCIK